ncbi:MAG: SLBB domain-containing protein [Bacteroidetes bacterium]|nr:SLBB domain-containing protein [Bacteroidota bacterium]
MKRYILLVFLFLIIDTVSAQIKDYELGASLTGQQSSGGFFDLSDPLTVNIKVAIWGFVRLPGRYVVPENTTITDLISYAGGPAIDAQLDNLRLYRVDSENNQQMIKFSFQELMWGDELKGVRNEIPALIASDVILVPGSPKLYFKDWFGITLSIISMLLSLTILILNINN